MGKKNYDSVEEIDESYHSEDDSGDDARQFDDDEVEGPIGNYVSDDSDEDGNDQRELDLNLKAQKEQAMALNTTWGTKKQNFYGRNKESDEGSDTDDDQDEEEQANRLQNIKALKMKRFMQQQQEKVVQAAESDKGEEDDGYESESSDDSDSDSGRRKKKIGDRLFAADAEMDETKKKASLSQLVEDLSGDKEMTIKAINDEAPELVCMISELSSSQKEIEDLAESLKLVKQQQDPIAKKVVKFIELKLTLLRSYSSFLTFYLLLRSEAENGKEDIAVEKHPVVFKLAQIKTIFESLQAVGEKVSTYLNLVKSGKKPPAAVEADDSDFDMEGGEAEAFGDLGDFGDYGDEGELDEDGLTKAQAAELENVVRMNQSKKQEKDAEETEFDKLRRLKLQAQKLSRGVDSLDDMKAISSSIARPTPKAKVNVATASKGIKKKSGKAPSKAELPAPVQKSQVKKFRNMDFKKTAEKDTVYAKEEAAIAQRGVQRKEESKRLKDQLMADIEHMDRSIQRNVQKDIIHNRGLRRRRKKIDGNPRVKKRLQFKKMEQKRKTVVQSYQNGHAKAYKGEASGINMGLVRSSTA